MHLDHRPSCRCCENTTQPDLDPPSCRPCIAHAPLKKPVHNPPEPEQELPVNNVVGDCLLFCCYHADTNTKYTTYLASILRDYVLGPQSRKFKSTCTVAIQLPLNPCYPVRPTKCASLHASHHASEPSQANIAASSLPKIDHPSRPISPAFAHSLLLLNLFIPPPARARDRRRLPRASPRLVSPVRQS
ncbi:hypothetical protein BDP55DRAFT_627215 [Colletotrichum godetiae]|uniref:Uncharacterized protein n=1 Tax=Colletotrichum godetiae TaxID=1209918 RepID=A0AAJ0F1C7_9PEZI|nr:uncharacterized protein BDP55DRAFT_627215 [Colletotrichum godetiae]KAK1691571.1 hypothetical protein BDP55DRAFT_627215 [Colletotrichum godetiae]